MRGASMQETAHRTRVVDPVNEDGWPLLAGTRALTVEGDLTTARVCLRAGLPGRGGHRRPALLTPATTPGGANWPRNSSASAPPAGAATD